jgi:hypothetical protein
MLGAVQWLWHTKTGLFLVSNLDGVCADFYDGLREVAAEWLGVPLETLTRDVTYGLPESLFDRRATYEDLHRFAVTERDLFRNLRPMHGAPASLRRIAHHASGSASDHHLSLSYLAFSPDRDKPNRTVAGPPWHTLLESVFDARQGRRSS